MPEAVNTNQPNAAARFTEALALERAKQCMAHTVCKAATELSASLALGLGVTREGGEVGQDYAFAACVLGNCGVLLTLENHEANAYPIDCPNFATGEKLHPEI